MAKRYNNQILLIILAALTLILVWTKFIRSPKKERTFKQELVAIDTARVSRIVLLPQAEKRTIELVKQENRWILKGEGRDYRAQKSYIQNLLGELMRMRAQRLVATSKDQWAEYQLTDSLATRVQVYESDRPLADVYIGRFTYKQIPQSQYGYGQQNIEGATYVRLSDEEEVYAVEGFLTMTFNQGFDHWRDHTFLKTRKNDLVKITFDYPADSSFVLEKTGAHWYVGTQKADSASVDAYLGQLRSRDLYDFAKGFQDGGIPDLVVTIEGNNMMPITLEAFRQDEKEYFLHSSLNPDAYFYSAQSGIFKDVFIPVSSLLANQNP
jgi:hypothetical protein